MSSTSDGSVTFGLDTASEQSARSLGRIANVFFNLGMIGVVDTLIAVDRGHLQVNALTVALLPALGLYLRIRIGRVLGLVTLWLWISLAGLFCLFLLLSFWISNESLGLTLSLTAPSKLQAIITPTFLKLILLLVFSSTMVWCTYASRTLNSAQVRKLFNDPELVGPIQAIDPPILTLNCFLVLLYGLYLVGTISKVSWLILLFFSWPLLILYPVACLRLYRKQQNGLKLAVNSASFGAALTVVALLGVFLVSRPLPLTFIAYLSYFSAMQIVLLTSAKRHCVPSPSKGRLSRQILIGVILAVLFLYLALLFLSRGL